MLKLIKSSLIIKKVFTYIFNRRKLQLIIYNKYLQSIFKINLTDFMNISGRYFIGERNGKGKEYDSYNNSLIFEGEYINGKRNGKGKEYNDSKNLIFEGGYSNGKRNGKGKEFNNKGKLLFEGEYLNGLKNGKGKDYDIRGELIFEGEYLKGLKWNGKGREALNQDNKRLELEVEYLNGFKLIKNCKEYNIYSKLIYEGEYFNGKRNGKGKEYNNDGNLIFEGEYYNNNKIRGKLFSIDGVYYFEGEFLYDKKWNGKVYYSNGKIAFELLNGKVKE